MNLYRGGSSTYDGPLDFYWHTHSAELMFLFLGVGALFDLLYRLTKKRIHTLVASTFGRAGLLTFVAIMTVDAVQNGGAVVFALTLCRFGFDDLCAVVVC